MSHKEVVNAVFAGAKNCEPQEVVNAVFAGAKNCEPEGRGEFCFI